MSKKFGNYYEYGAIDSDTWWIRDCFGNYCYLLCGRERGLLVDTAIGIPGLKELVQSLTQKPVTVILTHGHLDHIGGMGDWDQVWIHEKDREVLKLHQSCGYRRCIKGLAEEVGIMVPEAVLEACIHMKFPKTVRSLDEKEISMGNRRIRIINTPGHTRGSVCLWEEERGNLYSGDTVCEKRVMLSFPESAGCSEFAATMEKLMRLIDEKSSIYPGHNRIALSKQWILWYQVCARRLEYDSERICSLKEESVFGKYFVYQYGNVEITYKNG